MVKSSKGGVSAFERGETSIPTRDESARLETQCRQDTMTFSSFDRCETKIENYCQKCMTNENGSSHEGGMSRTTKARIQESRGSLD